MTELCAALLISLCLISGILLRYSPFQTTTTKKQKRILPLCYGSALMLNTLIMFAVYRTKGISMSFINYDGVLFGAAMALVNILVIRGRTKEHLFVYGIASSCNYLLLSAPTFVLSMLPELDNVSGYMAGTVLYGILLVALYWPMRQLLRSTVEPFLFLGNEDNYWGTIWFIPIAMFFAMIIAPGDNHHSHDILLLISRALMASVLVLMCLSIAADHKRLAKREAMEKQLTNQKLYYKELQIKTEDARKTRHDFKHHITAIQHFIDTDNKQGLQDYCNELSAHASIESQVPYTGNSAADAVIFRYTQLALEKDVHLEYSGIIRSHGIADTDLCILLGNALDNALTACVTAPRERVITLAARSEKQVLTILVQNTFDGVVNTKQDQILSRKRDNAPGIGLSSMHSICSRYGGSLELDWDERHFRVMILLPLK